MNEIVKRCLHCGNPMQTQRATKKYCSDNCKQEAYIKRTAVQGDSIINPVELHTDDEQLPEHDYDNNSETESQQDNFIDDPDEDDEDDDNDIENEDTEPDDAEHYMQQSEKRKKAKLDIDLMIMGQPKEKQDRENTKTKQRYNKVEEIEEEFEYRTPVIVKLIEEYLDDNDDVHSMFVSPHAYWHEREMGTVKWVSIRLRSLIETLLYLNQFRLIETKHVRILAKKATELMCSQYYKSLPKNYPLKDFIREQQQRLQKAAESEGEQIWVPVFEIERKAKFIAIRYQLASLVPKARLSQLDFKK